MATLKVTKSFRSFLTEADYNSSIENQSIPELPEIEKYFLLNYNTLYKQYGSYEKFNNEHEAGYGVVYFTEEKERIRFGIKETQPDIYHVCNVTVWTADSGLSKPAFFFRVTGIPTSVWLPVLIKMLYEPVYGMYSVSETGKVVKEDVDTNKKKNTKVNILPVEKEVRSSKDESDNEKIAGDKENTYKTLLEHLTTLVTIVAKKVLPGLIVTGRPGTSKSYHVEETLKSLGLKEEKDYVIIKGKSTTAALYETCYDHRKKIVVFDDCDSVFREEDSRLFLKAMLDDKKTRKVSSNAANRYKPMNFDYSDENDLRKIIALEDQGKYPSEYTFLGGIIILSNVDIKQADPDGSLQSRSVCITINPSDMELVDYMKTVVVPNIYPEVPEKIKLEAIDVIQKNNKLSIRSLTNAIKVQKSGVPNWKELTQFM